MIWFFVIAFTVINALYAGLSDDLRNAWAWEFEQASVLALSACFFLAVPYRSLVLKIVAAIMVVHAGWILATDWAIEHLSWWGYVIETSTFVVIAILVHERAKRLADREGTG